MNSKRKRGRARRWNAREKRSPSARRVGHELNCRQMLLDLKRLVRSLEGNFTPEMQLNDPRAKELQEEIKDLEDLLKRLLDVRDEKRGRAAADDERLPSTKGGKNR